ncbi:MAG: pyridoxamine 5'-phosphate oxidase family protein [Proteobacteria bacterium]|nr:pyridoxamine 5'-phosphate oxidase family protein [Pseudomonadota bacterium]
MISENPAFDEFLSEYRWAVLTSLRSNGQPVSSVVAYARDGDDLIVSTPGATFKRSSIERDSRVNLCVINNEQPFNFVAIEGEAVVEKTRLVETTRLVFKNIEGSGYQEPEDLEAWLDMQDRVIIRIRPVRVTGVIR